MSYGKNMVQLSMKIKFSEKRGYWRERNYLKIINDYKMNKFLLLLVIIPGFFCSSSSEEYEELDAVKDKQIFNPFKHENFEEKYFKLYRRVDGDIKEIEALLHY